jgi:hypothetical protein
LASEGENSKGSKNEPAWVWVGLALVEGVVLLLALLKIFSNEPLVRAVVLGEEEALCGGLTRGWWFWSRRPFRAGLSGGSELFSPRPR